MKTIRNLLPDSKLSTRAFIFVFTMLVFGFISIVLVKLFTNGDYNQLSTIRFAQLIESISIFVIPSLMVALLFSNKPFAILGLTKKLSLKSVLWLFALIVVMIPFVNLLASLNEQISLPASLKSIEDAMKLAEETAATLTNKLLHVHSLSALAFNLFLIALLPAIGEELFFRGTIQKMFSEKMNPVFAIWIAAIIFSIFHFQFYGFVPRVLLGALLGYLFYWSGNLWLPIIAHFLNNAFAVVFYYLHFNGLVNFDIDTVGSGTNSVVGIISGLISVFVIYKIYKSEKISRTK